jgi:hypothetical protein
LALKNETSVDKRDGGILLSEQLRSETQRYENTFIYITGMHSCSVLGTMCVETVNVEV